MRGNADAQLNLRVAQAPTTAAAPPEMMPWTAARPAAGSRPAMPKTIASPGGESEKAEGDVAAAGDPRE
jgi:hypothetical protein